MLEKMFNRILLGFFIHILSLAFVQMRQKKQKTKQIKTCFQAKPDKINSLLVWWGIVSVCDLIFFLVFSLFQSFGIILNRDVSYSDKYCTFWKIYDMHTVWCTHAPKNKHLSIYKTSQLFMAEQSNISYFNWCFHQINMFWVFYSPLHVSASIFRNKTQRNCY